MSLEENLNSVSDLDLTSKKRKSSDGGDENLLNARDDLSSERELSGGKKVCLSVDESRFSNASSNRGSGLPRYHSLLPENEAANREESATVVESSSVTNENMVLETNTGSSTLTSNETARVETNQGKTSMSSNGISKSNTTAGRALKDKSSTTPSKLLGYIAGGSRSASRLNKNGSSGDNNTFTSHDDSTPGIQSSSAIRRRKKEAKTPSVEKLQNFFNKTITINEEQVRTITIGLRKNKRDTKFDYKQRIAALEKACTELSNLCISLIGQTNQVQLLCVGHESEKDSELHLVKEQLKEIVEANAMLQSAETRMKNELKEATEGASKTSESYQRLKKEYEPTLNKVKEQETRIGELVAKLSTEQSSVTSLRSENEGLNKDCKTLEEQKKDALELQKKEFALKVKEYEEKITLMQQEQSMKDFTIERLEKSEADSKTALQTLENDSSKKDSRIEVFETENKRMMQEIDEFKSQIQQKDQDLRDASNNLSEVQRQNSDERGEWKSEVNGYQDKISSIQSEKMDLTTELVTKREENSSLTREISQLQDTIQGLNEKMEIKNTELLESKDVASQLEKERELRSQAEHREIAERNERIAATAQLLATQTDCVTRIESTSNKYKTEIDDLNDKVVSLTSSLEEKDESIRQEKDKCTGLENEMNELRHAVEHASANHETVEKLGKVTGELEILRRRMRETSDMKQLELGKSIARVEELEEQLKAGDVARRKLHNMIQELRGNVRVFARVRPFLPNDGVDTEASQPTIIPRSDETSLRIYKEQTTENRGEDHAFSFDKVFGPCSSQELVFNEVSEFVQSALDGYHVCLFSYGQTGSGKTHTMQGSGTGSMRGIVARAMEQVGQYKAELEEKGWEYSMEVSFLEIYNENIRDLLRSTPSDELKHDIKRDAQGNVTVTDLTKMKVDPKDTDQMNMIMDIAARHRSVGTTAMNARSSRSHSVFCLHLKACNAKQGLVLKGALNLVDLAGSERLDRSGATGDRMKETVAINKSLSSLTDVFVAIGNKQSHIPFRNSKLTYLLQPALSGDGKTLMMVNLSPTEASFQESLCSLRFAAQVNKCELGKPKKNTSNYSDESGKPSAASTGTSRVQGNKRSKR